MKKRVLSVLIPLAVVFSAFADVRGPQLVADYNRDGVIDEKDRTKNAFAGDAFTIWINDDNDADGANPGDTNSDLHDVPSSEGNARDCEDEIVNGRCDLLDFFPVLVDVTGVDGWDDYTWKLSSKSVNVVFTKLGVNNAGDFHTTDVKGFDGETSLYRATVSKLTEEDVELPDGFLVDKGRGVFLIEGAALVERGGITLRGEKDGNDPVETTLDLRVVNVESLYGWMNLRDKVENSTVQPSTSNLQPDHRHFILVHGYNTNHEEARGNAAEFYKKLYQSGSDAMLTAVEWRGDQSQINLSNLGVIITPNYFVNVENAFAEARQFADECKKLPGEKILVGHSLGNILISSAIKDYGLDYTKYVMLNAEVAGKDFEAGGRFANLPRTINYYSPSDPFFAESELDVENCTPAEFDNAFLEALFKEAKLWSLNEKIKESSRAIELANGVITNKFELSDTDIITEKHLKHAGVIASPMAGANSVATLENVDMDGFIGENWPIKEEDEDGDSAQKNVWNHSAFREVAFYHTSKFYTSLVAVGKPRIILDTDLGSCMDDLFTVDLAARMHKQGKLELKAVMMNRPDKSDPEEKGEFLTFADRYLASLGLGDLPLGKAEPLAKDRLPQRVLNSYWTLIYSNDVTNVGLPMPTNRTDEQLNSLTNAVSLYRRILEDAPDKSVIICSTGFLSNLKGLMESGSNYKEDSIVSTGMELIKQKVKELRIMAGCFDPDKAPAGMGGAEYNVAGDPVAAKMVLEQWPTPVIVSPWEVGLELEYKPSDVLADFPPDTPNPVARAIYERWPEPPSGTMNRLWDLMTVLPLTEGETLAPLSEMGGISVNEKGVTTFTTNPSSNRCYQVASNMNATAVMSRVREICREGRAFHSGMKMLVPYLHEVWYDGYMESDLTGEDAPFGDLPVEGFGGCSSVRVGNFHGRNLDIGISDLASIVVHMKAAKGRFASIGTTQWGDVSETALANGTVSAHRFNVMPNWMLDGINEKGVAINVNVIPVDVPQLKEGLDERPSLHARKVVRYVLDHAQSAEGAIEDLKKFRIYGNIGTGTYYLHWMISDAKQTFVVEIIKGEVVAREHPIMTNFNLNWDNKNKRAIKLEEFANWGPEKYFNPAIYSNDTDKILEVYTPHGDGVERYLTLRDAPYSEKGATFEGMFELMQLARYSRVAELSLDKTFRSDLTEINEPKKVGLDDIVKIYAAENFGTLQEVWKTLQPAMSNVYAHLADYRKPDELGEYSITTHNVTFDLEKRMFRIAVQEDYKQTFDCYLEPVSVTPGVPLVYDTAKDATNAVRNVELKPSEEVTKIFGEDAVSKTKYCNMFGFAIVPATDNKWAIVAELMPSAWTNLVESARQATRQIPVANIAKLELGVPTLMKIEDCEPGFYYTLRGASGVSALPTTEMKYGPKLSDVTGKVEFNEVKKPSDEAGFFTIGVSVTK